MTCAVRYHLHFILLENTETALITIEDENYPTVTKEIDFYLNKRSNEESRKKVLKRCKERLTAKVLKL